MVAKRDHDRAQQTQQLDYKQKEWCLSKCRYRHCTQESISSLFKQLMLSLVSDLRKYRYTCFLGKKHAMYQMQQGWVQEIFQEQLELLLKALRTVGLRPIILFLSINREQRHVICNSSIALVPHTAGSNSNFSSLPHQSKQHPHN